MSSGAPTVVMPSPTLVGLVWPARGGAVGSALRAAVLVLAGNLLLVLSAKVQVPLPPVPMTLQSLAVLVIGAAYGWRLGTATVLAYLAEGALGLPVFATSVPPGPAYFAGPTGGFLLGFVAAAFVVGFLAERGWDRPLLRVVLLMAIGHAVMFAFGLAWLALLFGPAKAWFVGAQPFLLGTAIKTALAAAVMQVGWSLVRS